MLSTVGLFLAPKWILLIYSTFSLSDTNITLGQNTARNLWIKDIKIHESVCRWEALSSSCSGRWVCTNISLTLRVRNWLCYSLLQHNIKIVIDKGWEQEWLRITTVRWGPLRVVCLIAGENKFVSLTHRKHRHGGKWSGIRAQCSQACPVPPLHKRCRGGNKEPLSVSAPAAHVSLS